MQCATSTEASSWKFLVMLKKISKLPPSPGQTEQACETWKLQESDPEPYRTWTCSFPKAISGNMPPSKTRSCLIFWCFLPGLHRATAYQFQEHTAADIKLQQALHCRFCFPNCHWLQRLVQSQCKEHTLSLAPCHCIIPACSEWGSWLSAHIRAPPAFQLL